MRFLENGPRIPDELLEERDNGNVVFFCGAGVSRPALPGFVELARQVMTTLGTPTDAKASKLLKRADLDPDFAHPIDQVFSLLQQEYGAGNIEDVVSKLLETSDAASTEQHELILRLSRSADRQVQLVTTNFDLLFERVDKSIKSYEPPALPDIASGQRLDGLVYLHGRLVSSSVVAGTKRGLVLGSADFGRAYLADGWPKMRKTSFRTLCRQSFLCLFQLSGWTC